MNIDDKIFLYKLRPTYYGLSEILLYCQDLTKNNYLFKDYDISVDFVIKNEELIRDIIKSPENYKYIETISSDKKNEDIKEKIKRLVGNELFSKIVFDEFVIKKSDDKNLFEDDVEIMEDDEEVVQEEVSSQVEENEDENELDKKIDQELESLEGSESDFEEDNESEFSE